MADRIKEGSRPRAAGRRRLAIAAAAVFALGLAAYAGARYYNHAALQTVLDKIIEETPDHRIVADLRHPMLVRFDIVVFNVRQVEGKDSARKLLELVFELSARLKRKHPREFVVAWRGRPLLFIDGETFERLGERFGRASHLELTQEMARGARLPDGRPLLAMDREFLGRLAKMLGAESGEAAAPTESDASP
ncbi:MAG: hypothetical protein M5R36_25370 [Deltaproteobacteria bacterium]|nr:hypothetical protein [Deltaproteobacteria bacterium]